MNEAIVTDLTRWGGVRPLLQIVERKQQGQLDNICTTLCLHTYSFPEQEIQVKEPIVVLT